MNTALEITNLSKRFWLFQGIESVIFFALAAALLSLALWWMRTRIS